MCLLQKGKQTFYQIDESYIKDNIFLNVDENEAAYVPYLNLCQQRTHGGRHIQQP